MRTALNKCLETKFPGSDFHSLGTGSIFTWKKSYLSYDNKTGWKIDHLNIFERIWRTFGGCSNTHLTHVITQLRNEQGLKPSFITHMNTLWNKAHPKNPNPLVPASKLQEETPPKVPKVNKPVTALKVAPKPAKVDSPIPEESLKKSDEKNPNPLEPASQLQEEIPPKVNKPVLKDTPIPAKIDSPIHEESPKETPEKPDEKNTQIPAKAEELKIPEPVTTQDIINTIHTLVGQQVNDDDIVLLLEGSGREEKEIRTLIGRLKNLMNRPTPIADNKPPAPPPPSLIIAENGVNQYQAKGQQAACTSIACKFLASKQPASPEMMARVILPKTVIEEGDIADFEGDFFEDTEDCLERFKSKLRVVENPLPDQVQYSPFSMQINFPDSTNQGPNIADAMRSILSNKKIDGAIITANQLTIAMRKQGTRIEFFDSHGDNELTQKGNAAYVKIFDDLAAAVLFLEKKFPYIGLVPMIQIVPIKIL